MNILRVIGSMHPSSGGPCQGIRNALPELKKLGLQNEVVSLDDPASGFPGEDPFPIFPLGPGKGPWCYSDKLIPWLLENLARFDVVIVHGLWLYHSYAVMKALRLLRNQAKESSHSGNVPKCYIMPHGMLDPYFQRAPERRVKAIRNWVFWKIIEAKTVSQADGLLFTCETELRLARKSFYPYQPKREINIGYGIAEPPLYSQPMQMAFEQQCPGLNGDPYFLFIGRIHEKKGVDLLIKAYLDVRSKYMLHKMDNAMAETGQEEETERLNENWNYRKEQIPNLVIAGPGLDTNYGLKIQQLVKENPVLPGSVYFPGMLSGNAKWGAFYGCEAFILPSHQENFGIAVVEALACGKPVLISDQVNLCNMILSNGAGMVAADTLQGTQSLLEFFLQLSDEEKGKIGNNAFSLYQQQFAIGPVAKQFRKAMVEQEFALP